MEPEEAEVCPRNILRHSTRGGSNIFQLFDTAEKKDHFVASRRRWLERQGEKAALQESGQNAWQDVKYEGRMAKNPSLPREVDENAGVAAKLVFNHGGRKSVDFCGRQAQAARRLCGDGQENAGIPGRQ